MTSFKFQNKIESNKRWYYGLVFSPFLIAILAFFIWGNLFLPVSISCDDATVGADIYVDGKLKSTFDTNVSDFRVFRGHRQFTIKKAGYRDTTFEIIVTNEIYPYVELHPISDSAVDLKK